MFKGKKNKRKSEVFGLVNTKAFVTTERISVK